MPEILDYYLDYTLGILRQLPDGKLYLELPGESFTYDTLEELLSDVEYTVNEWQKESKTVGI